MQLTVAAIAVLLGLVASSGSASATGCAGGNDMWGSTCHASTDGSTVELGASHEDESGSSHDTGSHQNTGPRPSPTPTPTPTIQSCPDHSIDCFSVIIMRPRAEDLASFAPKTASLAIEPDGVGLVGAPTNVVGAVPAHTLTGTLFDRPVTVRFTPAGYAFDYGDGSTATTRTGGASWRALGQAQLTSTPTSHVYRARGTYTVSARVIYDAAVDWGDGVWYDVIGQVRSIPSTTAVRVYEARTALVAHTCDEAPSAPGC